MVAPFPMPTQTYHTKSYSSISPDQPALSQQGKNIVVTGGGTGIGGGIALSLARAKVSNLALLGRRVGPLEQVKKTITASYPETSVYVYSADISDLDAMVNAFNSFAKAVQGPVHTVMANAGWHPGVSTAPDDNNGSLMASLEINAGGTANTVRAYLPHIPAEPIDASGYRGRIVHTSSGVTHVFVPDSVNYGIGKLAGAGYLQYVALNHPELQIINFHPGILATDMSAVGSGLEATDEISLPADWAVWAGSPESAFLGSGRLVWAHWDVNELKERFERMRAGKEKDGDVVFGALPVHQQFTIGLVDWIKAE
ncbi:hypothetical protein LTR64_002238 [Lithohypha guttulata]|uniref:uncharacterized protein n=1 Tax=Lithohypha guttulata TaxID=1690604 RepID=UPI002DDEC0FB|nr:hypothetical protein LTR51_001535 [Lithohypha guttulata]